jgi:hypothetical protein
MPPGKIHMLRFIMEAYEGIGLITTLDPALGLIEISIAPGCEDELAQILNAEEVNLQLRQVYLDNRVSGH